PLSEESSRLLESPCDETREPLSDTKGRGRPLSQPGSSPSQATTPATTSGADAPALTPLLTPAGSTVPALALDPDLARIVHAWADLAEAIKKAVLALVGAAGK